MSNPRWPHVQDDVDRYGFRFGAAVVERLTHVEGRSHVIGLDTPYRHVQIGVSPTGRSVRVWIDHKRLVALSAEEFGRIAAWYGVADFESQVGEADEALLEKLGAGSE